MVRLSTRRDGFLELFAHHALPHAFFLTLPFLPSATPAVKFRQTIEIGLTRYTRKEVDHILHRLGTKYTGAKYHLVGASVVSSGKPFHPTRRPHKTFG